MPCSRFARRPLPLACFAVGLAVLSVASAAFGGTNLSSWVYPGSSGRLLQRPDALGNRVMDYSNVGYRGGVIPIPYVPARVTISPVEGDDGASIQAAINQVAAMPVQADGFRGAVVLTAGEYQISNYVTISTGGVVLRGVGDGTNGTVLRAAGAGQRTLVRISGSGSPSTVSGTTHNLTDYYVPVGARSFNVDSTSGLAVGDRVMIRRIATDAWIHDLGMDLLCCPPDVNPWTASGYNIDMDRVITHIEGNRVTVDAPITCAIEQKYAGGTIRKYTWPGRIQNVGVEDIRGVSDYVAADDEDHGWTFIQFNNIEHAWVRRVTSQYFGYACVALYNGTQWATVADCRSLDPISIVTGGRRYAFVMDDNRLCLVQNCYTSQDRHQFVTQSLTTGPNVFVDGISDSAKSDAGPHHRWATAALWDNVTVNGNNLNIQNRGNLGSGHGWAGANCSVWNADADGGYVVQNPPTARNWLIGSVGAIENGTVYVGPHDPGTYDSHGSNVFPNSLYYAQLQDRLAAPNLQTREYWLGDIDGFGNAIPTGEAVPVDAAWLASIQTAAGAQAVDGFDVITNGHWVPFTFNFSLSPTEHVVAASLSLAMRAVGGAADDVLYLDSLTNGVTLSSLGWTPISTTTNPTVRVLDLASNLAVLADGRLNLALQNDIGIDWAMLELQVAPNLSAGNLSLPPVADATVRGGVSANSNFGAASTLTLKEDSSADNDRKAYLRWDLSSVTGVVYQARVRLTPLSVGTNGIEQCAALCTNAAWSETGITWNNQPGAGKRFVSWIPGTNGPVEFMVTPQVLAAMAGDRQFSLQLFSLRNTGAAGLVDFASREDLDPNRRPQLLLLVSDAPPGISNLTNRVVNVNASTGPVPFTVGDDKTAAGDLTLGGLSGNTNLVPLSGIIFGGSGSNRTVTVTPAANQSGSALIIVTVTDGSGLASSAGFTLTVASHPPGVFVWNGPGAGANPWSTSGNWAPNGPPEALDDLKFFDTGAVGVAVSNVNNVVDAAFGGVVSSVHYGNTNGNITTLIAFGKTLSISGSGGLKVGTETDNGTAQVVNTTITGPGATVALDGGDWIVRQATDGASGGTQRATLNMAGLDLATGNINRLLVGTEGASARVTGTLYLAKTNRITASGNAPALAVGGAGGGSGNAGGVSHLYLGRTNAILANSLAVGRGKQGLSGGVASSIRFNPVFTNANPLLGGGISFRAVDGASRMANWLIADSGNGGGTVNTVGACDFSGGVVDAMVDTITVGKTSGGSGVGNPNGVLAFDAGVIDVNTLQLGYQSVSGSNSAVGLVNVRGGTLLVNTAVELGHVSGGAGATNTAGTLAVNGGSVFANGIVVGSGSGANALSVAGGSLVVSNTAGAPGAPISAVSFTDAALYLSVSPGRTNLVAGALTTGGTTNTIHIAAMPIMPAYPAQFVLLQYAGAIGGGGFNFVLGNLPDIGICGGYLSNNLAGRSVDLVITNCIVPDTFLTWEGSVNGDWDIQTANWKNNVGLGLVYADGENVVFNDQAGGATNISLTASIAPGSVTVSNHLKTFMFTDLGKLTGSGELVKTGSGALIIANEGINDFTGGVAIEGGVLRIGSGGPDGVLPGGAVVNNASLVFNRSNDLTATAVISGSGPLTKEGAGVLTLSGANTFTGAVTVAQGVLRAGHASALGTTNGFTSVASGATLDVNHLNLGLERVTVVGAGVGGRGALVDNSGNPSYVSPNLAYVTLAGDTTVGGTGRLDLRSSSTSATNAVLSTVGQPWTLSKTGTNQFSLVAVYLDPALGDIEVRQGLLSVEKVTSSLGNPSRTLSVSNAATLQFYQVSNVVSKVLMLANGATVLNYSGTNTFGGPVTLQGSAAFNVGGTWLRLTNALSGPGSLVKTGSSTLFLAGISSFSGSTLVNSGTLALVGNGSVSSSSNLNVAASAALDTSGRADGTLTLASGQVLCGNGTLNGSLVLSPGATLAPGLSVGHLTVTNTVALQGVTLMELDKSAMTNDVLGGAVSISYGGTLSLTNLGGTLAAGDSFKLFAASAYTGAFTNVTPAIPGIGLAWNTQTLAIDGTLRIVSVPTAQPKITRFALDGSALVIRATDGVPGWPCELLSATNLSLPLAQWSPVATNWFDAGGTLALTNPVNPAALRQFFRLRQR